MAMRRRDMAFADAVWHAVEARGARSQVIHCIDSLCKSHRFQVRSRYAAAAHAAARGMGERRPARVTRHALIKAPLGPL
eukprot:556483-Pyramimonas_sp.AAC.1